MYKSIFNYLLIIALFLGAIIGCEDNNKELGRVIDPNKAVGFLQDTFRFREDSGAVVVPIVVPKYVNNAVHVTLTCEDGTAVRDTHFYIEDLEAKIAIGGTSVDFPFEIYDDTLINADRVFYLEIADAKGGGVPGLKNQRCAIIIENNDFLARTAVSFNQKQLTTREDAQECVVPFSVLGELEGDAIVKFSADKLGTAKENIHFRIKTKEVHLKKGDTKGEVILEIINDDEENDIRQFDLFMSEAEGVVLGSDQQCRISILNDDEVRYIEFRTVNDSILENAGTAQIVVDIKGIKYDQPIIEGELIIDSLVNTTADAISIVGDTKFKTCGDTTLIFTVNITDNTDFYEWGAYFNFRGLKEVTPRPEQRRMYLKVMDNERVLSFGETEVDVLENFGAAGRELEIPIIVEGGKTLVETEVRVNILEDITLDDASGKQYEIRTPTVKLPVGVERGLIKVKINRHPSKYDTYFKMGIESLETTASVAEGSECTVTILNQDMTIEVDQTSDMLWTSGSGSFKVEARNITEAVKVKCKISYLGGLHDKLNVFVDAFEYFPLSQENPSMTIDYNVTGIDANSGSFIFNIEEVYTSAGGNDVVLENSINPIKSSFELTVVKDLGEISRTDWSVHSFSTEEDTGESGGANGRCIHAIDGNEGTFWHSKWMVSPKPDLPHEIIYDMGQTIQPKQGYLRARSAGHLADCKYVRYYISENAEGPWVQICDFDNRTNAKLELTRDVMTNASGRYLRVVVPVEHGKNDANFSEVKLFGGIVDHKNIVEEQ
ncbi:MAG: discoidin domain-containing protein [Marinifilaceae bacterium]